jgi:carbamoylphosphate synthase small subunit
VIEDGRPLLGICLGHQIIGRAAGAQTKRLPFGHHAANHPVKDLETGLVQVTAQNHEVTVIADTLPAASGFVVSQIDLNDGSVEGLRHRSLPIETVQYHPEGGPGPLDALAVFDRFVSAARARHGGAAPEPTVGRAGPLHLDTAELARRLPFGHHAANHPVKDLETGLVQVTAQNHEVTVIADTLPEASGFIVSQIDLNDGSVEGLRHRGLPIETVQYHPEGGPGPLDALAVFDRFVAAAKARHGGAEPEATVGKVEPLHLDTAELNRRLRGMD